MVSLLAQIRNPVLPEKIGAKTNLTGGDVVGRFLSSIFGILLIFAFITAFGYLITGAFHWITSGGDKTHLENARNRITHAIMGLIIIASLWAVAKLVGDFIGIDFEKLPIPVIPTG